MLVSGGWVLRLRRVGAAATLSVLPVAAAGMLRWAAAGPLGAVRAPGPAAVDQLVALGAAAGCGVALATLALGAALTALIALTGRIAGRGSEHGERQCGLHSRAPGSTSGADLLAAVLTPALVRRLVGVALGVSLVGATLGPASAEAHRAAQHVVADALVDRPAGLAHRGGSLVSGWSPDRPAAPRRTAKTAGGYPATTTPGRTRPEDIVVVRRGDTLWDIAARALGPHATAREVAAAWPPWHHANRHTIGADPDLLKPGQRLRRPAFDQSSSVASSPHPVNRKEEP